MTKSTMFELVDELRKLPDSPEIREMIREARAGEYHDYKSKRYICGKYEAVKRLRRLKFPELANRIVDGEFDELPDEEDTATFGTLEKFEGGYIAELMSKIEEV